MKEDEDVIGEDRGKQRREHEEMKELGNANKTQLLTAFNIRILMVYIMTR
jgi:hypothetical protein